MTDFWELLGRMFTDNNFRTALYGACPNSYYKVDSSDPSKLVIPGPNYGAVRAVIANVITDGPVSLMTLGELLMALSSQEFRDRADKLAQAIQASSVTPGGRSKLFYTAAGIMMIDDSVRDSFANGIFDKPGFSALTQKEQTDLGQFAVQGGPVLTAANYMCALLWGHACLDKLKFYAGHEHPLAAAMP